jgi:hypothetical protein
MGKIIWAGNVASIWGKFNVYSILLGRYEGKRALGRTVHR